MQAGKCGYLLLPFAAFFIADLFGGDAATVDRRAKQTVRETASSEVNWKSENSFKTAHFVASAKFAEGRDKEAREIIERAVKIRPLVEYFDAEFPLWSTMDCYMRWKDVPGKYTPELKKKTKAYVAAARKPSDATTYNHHWMLAAGLILAYQEWGKDITYTFKNHKDDRDGRKWALAELDRIVRSSHTEDLSETYARFSMGSILSLHDFAKDPLLRAKAKQALDRMVLHHAAFFFKGHTAGSTRRTYGPMRIRGTDLAPSWLFFGGPSGASRTTMPFALSNYRPPEIVRDLAWDRDESYLQLASRIAGGRTERQLSFFNKTYVLFSEYPVRNYLGPRDTWYHERLAWAVRWEGPEKEPSSFFIKHSCPKKGMLYLGDTQFHQVLQHEKALVGICKLPSRKPDYIDKERWLTYLLGAFPASAKAILDESSEGRLYLHYGCVLIALHVTQKFEVVDSKKRGVREFRVPAGKSGLEIGYAVETTLPGDHGTGRPDAQLAAFRKKVAPCFDKIEFGPAKKGPLLRYGNAAGVKMELGWREPGSRTSGESSLRLLNGKPIPAIEDDKRWPLLKNPRMLQACGEPQLRVRDNKGKEIVFDFSKTESASTSPR